MNGKIISALKGRTGNQMFCLAAAFKIAKDTNSKVIGCYQSEEKSRWTPSDYLKNTIFRKVNFLDSIPTDFKIYPSKPNSYSQIPNVENIILNDYFQDVRFVDKNIAYSLFGIYDSIKEEIHSLYGDLSDYVSVHIRRGDYATKSLKDVGYKTIDKEFVLNNLSKFFNGSKVIVLSDDINWCKEIFSNENFIYADKQSRNSIETDLYIQTLCGKGNIISNSTFSWWGAYLNPSPTKKVIVSYPWYNNNYLNGGNNIIPEEWIKIKD